MIMEIDNTNCKADIPTISIGVHNTVAMRSNQSSTSDHGTIFTKQINGVAAGQSAVVSFISYAGTKCHQGSFKSSV